MKIINLKTYKGPRNYIYCGRPSPLGNPFPLTAFSREESVRRYELHLESLIVNKDAATLKEMRRINEDSVLACFCFPLLCHCNVIEKLWRKYFNGIRF